MEEKESRGERLRALVNERQSALAHEMLALFERTVAELEEEVRVLKEENERQRQLLQSARRNTVKPEVPGKKTEKTKTEDSGAEPVAEIEGLTENSSTSEADDEQETSSKPPAKELKTERKRDSDREETSSVQTQSSEKHKAAQDTSRTARRVSKSKEKESKEKGPFTCSVCNKSFRHKCVLSLHSAVHSDERPFECSECGKGFKRKDHLQRHMETHSRKRPFSSSDCKNSLSVKPHFISKLLAERVKQPEQNTSVLPESECRKQRKSKTPVKSPESVINTDSTVSDTGDDRKQLRTTHEKSLRKRMLSPKNQGGLGEIQSTEVHTRRKPFSCSVCKKGFQSKALVKRHMITHTDEKPFECSVCEKSYRYKRDWDDHMRKHTGEEPYSCSVCNKCFTSKHSLRAHMRKCTGEKCVLSLPSAVRTDRNDTFCF